MVNLSAENRRKDSLLDEASLRLFFQLSGDYYWEQDAELRYTRVVHARDPEKGARLAKLLVGRTCREIGGNPIDGGSTWDEHRVLCEARLPFKDFVLWFSQYEGGERYLSISGQPRLDGDGTFQGYAGLIRDVTHEKLQERAASTFELAAIGIGHVTSHGRFIHVNRKLCDMLGYSREELLSLSIKEITHPDDMHVTDEARAQLRAGEIDSFQMEKRYVRKDGRAIWVKLTVANKRDAHGEPLYDISVVEDLTEQRLMQEQLRRSEELFHSTFDLAAIGICHVDPKGNFVHVNRKVCEMLGYTREELLGLNVKAISYPGDEHITDEDRNKLRSGQIDSFQIEKRYMRKDGTPTWARLTITSKRGPNGEALHDISVIEDISARKEAEARVQYLATHDGLTGLPNRNLFTQLLKEAISTSRRYQRPFCVLFLDLDRFKQINDSLGHEAGDKLLQEMARRFRACLRESDVVARLGGDEFVILLQEIHNPEMAAVLARKLLSAAIRPVEILEQDCRVTASIGICRFPEDAQDEQALMKGADMAMYLAKSEGKNNFQFFSEEIASTAIEKLAMEANLRLAMERNEFRIHYQAKVNIQTGEIKGAEALLRWNSAVLGPVSPNHFIPVAEEMGLIIPLGKWVLKSACEQWVAWRRNGLPSVCISVNLSPRQFSDPDLVQDVARIVRESNMSPDMLELEITESMVMHHPEQAIRILSEIKKMGVRIAIDDFGTGYSSLSQLKRFPIDTLKVDRSFIREIPRDEEDRAITRAIISMGKTLGLTVVAEGVETAEQQSFLSTHACEEMQGFYFSKPSEPEEFESLLREHKPGPRT